MTQKIKKWSIIFGFVFSFIAILLSSEEIIAWQIDNYKTNKTIAKLQSITSINEIADSPTTNIIESVEEQPKTSYYWQYLNQKLIDVDFTELQKINPDTIGWIQVNGTNINYPFVQTKDNSYYLNHSFDQSNNNAGWVFLDYRNHLNNLDNNTILYAHGRLDTTMFGSLKNLLKSSWYDNPDNYLIKLSTPTSNSLWQVFSVYHLETTNDYIYTNFLTTSQYQDFLNTITSRSIYNFNTTLNTNDKIITLSTCYNKDEKMVMHAKLIKYE